MNKIDLNIETASSINYQFTAIPTNLFYLLDNNTRTLLFCLIQSSTYFAKEDGFFYITKETIGELTNLSVNVITAAIDTLYINGLVYVKTVGKSKGKYVNHYRVNFEEFRRFEDYTIEELKNPSNKIEIVKYKNNYQPQYIKDYLLSKDEGKQERKEERKQQRKKVITNKDNINNIDNIENIDKINNIKEKEINTTLEQYNEINVNSKINNSKFEIKEVNHVGNEKKDMLLQSILNFKSSLENYKDNKPLAISIANGFYDKNKTSIEECNLNSVWDDVMHLINNIPTVEQNIPTLDDDEEDETYHYQDERSEFDKKLDAYARQVATGKLNFSTIM